MATIRKRGAYQWEAQIRKRGFPAQSKTFTTRAEADAWAKMVESEMSRGVWLSRGEAESTTLFDALTRYQKEIVPNKKGAIKEKSVIRICMGHPISKCFMAGIRSSDIAKLRDDWLKTYAPATVLRRIALLSHVFNVSRKEWGMESLVNPVELIRKPQPNNARTRRVADDLRADIPKCLDSQEEPRKASENEIIRIIRATQSKILPSIIELALETAMRRNEIVELRWRYIDLDKRVAHLPNTKNGDPRDVPLSTKAVNVFKYMQSSEKKSSDDRVFKISGDAITGAFERAVRKARKQYENECGDAGKIPNTGYLIDLRFHDLRHEATSRLADIFHMHELTKITGHKDPRMLMRYYHPKAEDLAKKLD